MGLLARRAAFPPLAGTVLGPGLRAWAAAEERIAPGTVYPTHQLQDTVLYLTVSGRARTSSGGQIVECRPKSVLVLPRGARIREEAAADAPWHVQYFLMRGPVADRLETAFWGDRPRVVTAVHPAPARWRQLLTEIVQISLAQPPDWAWQVFARLGPLLDQVRQTNTRPADLAARAQRLALSQTDRRWTLKELAAELEVSPSLLTHRFKHLTGESVAHWIRRTRIAAATRLLEQGLSATAVADCLGYSSPYHFSRVFKQVTGRPPSAARTSVSPLHPGSSAGR